MCIFCRRDGRFALTVQSASLDSCVSYVLVIGKESAVMAWEKRQPVSVSSIIYAARGEYQRMHHTYDCVVLVLERRP